MRNRVCGIAARAGLRPRPLSSVGSEELDWNRFAVLVAADDTGESGYSLTNGHFPDNTVVPVVFLTARTLAEVLIERADRTFPSAIVSTFCHCFERAAVQAIARAAGTDTRSTEIMPAGAQCGKSLVVSDSKRKNAYIEELLAGLGGAELRQRVSTAVKAVADEMITNALYNAPTDDSGKPCHASTDRRKRIVLEEARAPRLSYAGSRDSISLTIRDPFGSLRAQTVFKYLGKALVKSPSQIDRKPGGAGLGLFTIFTHVNGLLVHIQPGHFTEVTGTVCKGQAAISSGAEYLSVSERK